MKTMVIRRVLCGAFGLVMTAPVALAGAIDADVLAVVTAGQWQDDTGQGVYRIVVRQQGFEHVSTGVAAEWVDNSYESGAAARIVASEPLVVSGLFSLGVPTVAVMDDRLRVSLVGVNTYESTTPVSCTFDLWPDKTVTVVKACG
jgi:hypothetical protein